MNPRLASRGGCLALGAAAFLLGNAVSATTFDDAALGVVNYRLATVIPATSCGSLAGRLNDTVVVDSATLVPATAAVPEFCQVLATGSPQVKMEIALPTHWNRRLYMQGNGGFAGEDLAAAGRVTLRNQGLQNGFVAMQTNTGHVAGTAPLGSWAENRPDLMTDYAYRAVHLTNATARELVEKYYDRGAAYAYWNACSTGGREALMSAQRYPADFDGYIGNAPFRAWVDQQIGYTWNVRATDAAPLTPGKVQTAYNAVLAKCDPLDGLADHRVVDARVCSLVFNPDKDLPACAAGVDNDSCLTPAQIGTLKKVWSGPVSMNRRLFPGFPITTEPAGWSSWFLASGLERPFSVGNLTYFAPYPETNTSRYSVATFNFDTDPARLDPLRALLDANNPDLSAFKALGGKFISVHGMSDPALTPFGTIEYFDKVQAKMGDTSSFFRLYLNPGMAHCSGGTYSADPIDLMTPLVNWVEAGVAPDTIRSTKLDAGGNALFTRKLCPYPQMEKYVGGDPNSASSFTCEVPQPVIAELQYGDSVHYVLGSSTTESYDVANGKAGTAWKQTGGLWLAWAPGTPGTQGVCRFYFPSSVDGGAHFYTMNQAECGLLRAVGSPWIDEGVPFAAKSPSACASNEVLFRRYYKGDASTGNVPQHRYVSDPAVQAQLSSQGWVYESDAFCLGRLGG